MFTIKKLRFVKRASIASLKIYNILFNSKYENNRHIGEIIRDTHSLEKGLSLEKVRLGFGINKINEAYQHIKAYKKNGGDMTAEPLLMFVDALHAYLVFHQEQDFFNDTIRSASKIYTELQAIIQSVDDCYGGVIKIKKNPFTPSEIEIIERLFNGRHSVREFEQTPIDETRLKKSIELAMRCPSACNRQCHRIHIVDKKDFSLLNNWFDGVGGFADSLDKLIFVTGNISMYRPEENGQWIVTGTIFASYLTLAFETYGIGCCFIQRPLIPNPQWNEIRDKIGASEEEILICCLGVGNMKNEYTVPVSHRLKYETIVNRVQM